MTIDLALVAEPIDLTTGVVVVAEYDRQPVLRRLWSAVKSIF